MTTILQCNDNSFVNEANFFFNGNEIKFCHGQLKGINY